MPSDPVLECNEIQGDSIAGFRKDYETLLFFQFDARAAAAMRKWIGGVADRLSYADAMLAFNKAYRTMRLTLQADPPLTAAWTNLAFTTAGLGKLLSAEDHRTLAETFKAGAAAHAGFVGDPTDGSAGDPRTWMIGGPDSATDGALLIAADERKDRDDLVEAMIAELQSALSSGAITFHRQDGNTRPDSKGHEHFGFKDGISQPGIRGVINHAGGSNVTQRLLDDGDPSSALFGSPGSPLCWPGSFVLGYPRKRPGSIKPNDIVTDKIAPWLRNGSYIVYRRLRQDVAAFHSCFAQQSSALANDPYYGGITPERLEAICVGRWTSGTPTARKPLQDDEPGLQRDIYAQNNFAFDRDSVAPRYRADMMIRPDVYAMAKADPNGHVCPFGSHVRKVNPRDDITDQGAAVRTLEHRILRRGIPFGPSYDPNVPGSDKVERGLHFVCYQASIDDGFGFLMHQWVNLADAPHAGGGIDPIIGNGAGAVNLCPPSGHLVPLHLNQRFVIATGAAYLFAPSRTALKTKLGA